MMARGNRVLLGSFLLDDGRRLRLAVGRRIDNRHTLIGRSIIRGIGDSTLLMSPTLHHVGVSALGSKSGTVCSSGIGAGEARGAAPGGLGAVDRGVDADGHGSIGANVVLVGTVLTALGGNTLQLLLGRRISVANLHEEALFTNGLAMVALDDLLADITGLETSETNATAVAHAVAKDLAGQDLEGVENGDQLSLGDGLGQVGDVQIGRTVVALGLETSIEALACKANLVAQEVEALDALLGVTDILELGKAESLASASGGVNDGLALLNLTETRSILQQQLIIGGRVQTADVDVLVALDAVLKALIETLALLGSGENSGDSSRNLGVLLDKCPKLSLRNSLDLGSNCATDHSRHSKLLRGWGGVTGAVCRENTRAVVTVHATEEGSTRGGLSSSGGVGSSTVVQAGHVTHSTIDAVTIGGGSTRSVGEHDGAVATRDSTLGDVVAARNAASINSISSMHAHVERSGDSSIGGIVHDRSVDGHIASVRHGNRSSTLRKVIISQAESAEVTNKTTKAVMVGGRVVHATSSSDIVRSSIGSHVSRGHAMTRSLVVGVGSHSGRSVVRHGEFLGCIDEYAVKAGRQNVVRTGDFGRSDDSSPVTKMNDGALEQIEF